MTEVQSCDLISVRDQGAVPVRWTSPEALFEGLYSEKNMVYSVGCVMYELWTHGCQPFTSYDQTMDTDDILKMVKKKYIYKKIKEGGNPKNWLYVYRYS